MTIINYKASPTMKQFHKSKAFVRGIMGPIGSGKSVACCIEGYRLSSQVQIPNSDGVRKSRGLVVRNTLPELETTTMKTWSDWFPPGDPNKGFFGRMTRKPPYTHYIKQRLSDGTVLDLEVLFLALDRPEDAKKLLSLECSWIFFNEMRELEKPVLDAGTGRVGRYPSIKDGGCTRPAIIMDTNPPDDSHFWHELDIEDGWRKDEDGNLRPLEDIPEDMRWEFFTQPSGLSEAAENLENLNQPANFMTLPIDERRRYGRQYYERLISGKTKEWVNVYVHGQYGFIKAGQPVFDNEWNPEWHVSNFPIEPIPGTTIYIGVDASGRHPAAIAHQKTVRGQWQALEELVVEDGMGAENFSKLLRSWVKDKFPQNDCQFWGDPAGAWGQNTGEETYFDIMRAHDIPIMGSPALRIEPRLETMRSLLSRAVDGQPGYIVSPNCKMYIRGMNGGYRYRKLAKSGDATYANLPDKNKFADVQDAAQYVMCAVAEVVGLTSGLTGVHRQTHDANVDDWGIFS